LIHPNKLADGTCASWKIPQKHQSNGHTTMGARLSEALDVAAIQNDQAGPAIGRATQHIEMRYM